MSRIINILLVSCLLGVESYPHQDSSLGIAGGEDVDIIEVPFMARYRNLNSLIFCGAAIINEKYLISSALCQYMYKKTESKSYVIVGTDNAKTGGEAYDIAEAHSHSKYEPFQSDYDVAVLKLVKSLTFNERVKPISLAAKGFVVPEEAEFEVLGFGDLRNTDVSTFLSIYLRDYRKSHVPLEKCKETYSNVTERIICAGNDKKGTSIFDYGGPLIHKGKLLGVACCMKESKKGKPSVFTYIPPLRDFIDDIMKTSA